MEKKEVINKITEETDKFITAAIHQVTETARFIVGYTITCEHNCVHMIVARAIRKQQEGKKALKAVLIATDEHRKQFSCCMPNLPRSLTWVGTAGTFIWGFRKNWGDAILSDKLEDSSKKEYALSLLLEADVDIEILLRSTIRQRIDLPKIAGAVEMFNQLKKKTV